MRRRLICLSITLSTCVAVSVAGADVRQWLNSTERKIPQSKEALAYVGAGTINARTYRSPGRYHKLMVPSENRGDESVFARTSQTDEIADYGSFKLLALNQTVLDEEPPGSRSASVRDDLNVLFLRSGAIDTTSNDAPGELLGLGGPAGGIGSVTGKTAFKTGDIEPAKSDNSHQKLRLVQFIGPVKREWLDRLRSSGVELVAYLPNNAYLVYGDEPARSQLLGDARNAQSRGEGFVQWEGPFLDQYKIHPALAAHATGNPNAEVTVAVQIAHLERDQGVGAGQDTSAAIGLASAVIGDAYQVLGFTNLKIRIHADRIAAVAALANVVNVEPWVPPVLLDERAAQICAGALTADGKQPSGPGYLSWLQSRGFNSKFAFAIDVSDSGIDRGSIASDKLHPDFLDSAKQSRVSYARDYTSELDPSDQAGHGTINASIAAGGNTSTDASAHDSDNFNYGLGVAPFALIGVSKIFQADGTFDLIDPYTKLISEAYRDGARISSNSWSAITNSYTIDSQEYDTRARDAVPAQAGNQEMVICFAAGNSGADERIGSPGTGKNLISVGASESFRKTGTDGCGVKDTDADSALDMAFFSSGGKVDDGRMKPDLAAAGTHIQGAASQHPDFNGTGVCGDLDGLYFPKGQTLYTWSSGTSHSTPAVAGAAALTRQFFLNLGEQPSAALVKALLLNTTTYMTGALASGDLPQKRQGWGLLDLGRAFDTTPKVFINQSQTFTDSGQEFVFTGEVKDPTRPFRVTLAWTDAPGFSAFAPWVNDLDLEVTINGQTYRGNNFKGQQSQPEGEPDTRNNVEGVWLPAGTVGTFVLRVRATNIAGDGVPGNSDLSDQDFALVIYNAERKDTAVMALAALALAGGTDAIVDPGESVSMRLTLKNVSPFGFTAGRGTLTTSSPGVTIGTASADFPSLAPGALGESLTSFAFSVDRTVACGTVLQFALDVAVGASTSRVPFTVAVGNARPLELFSDDLEAGESKWTHDSGVKKKKNRIDTWETSTKRFRSGSHSWFSPDMGRVTDAHLDIMSLQLPADGRNLELVFYHTFEFERGQFDGGVLEISAAGGDFEDLGSRIVRGGYNGLIRDFTDNPLSTRPGWVDGRLGQFQQVVVDLSSYAGKTVVIRFRIGSDQNVRGQGWYIDDVTVGGKRVSCTPATQ
ncbi:MAG TPA: S8 family serine peptidase [Blastocatellia bacterium]|nr:S8 family serine peptidase [Blastocatellia bacterium]